MRLVLKFLNLLKQGYNKTSSILFFKVKLNNNVLNILKLLSYEGHIIGFNNKLINFLYVTIIKLKYFNSYLPAIGLLKIFLIGNKNNCISLQLLKSKYMNLIITTKKGMLSSKLAIKNNLGGFVICQIN